MVTNEIIYLTISQRLDLDLNPFTRPPIGHSHFCLEIYNDIRQRDYLCTFEHQAHFISLPP